MAMEQITDHAARALSRVITALRGTEFENLVRAFMAEVQACENAIFSMLAVIRDPAAAEGTTLDLIGKIVGAEERGALDDAEYRTRIAAAIARNRSWTEPESVIATVRAFFPYSNHRLRDADVEGARSAVIIPESYEIDTYAGVTPAEAEEFMRYVARTSSTRLIFHYASTPHDGNGTLALFDSTGDGFDGSVFAAAVDQNTRN